MGYSPSDVKVETVGEMNIPGQNNIVIQLEAKVAASLVGAVKKVISDAVQSELRKHIENGRSLSVSGIEVRYSKVRDDGVVTEMTAHFGISEEVHEVSNDVADVVKQIAEE